MPQQPNSEWTPVDAAPTGWEEVPSTGMRLPKGSMADDSSAVSGFFRRGRDTIKGLTGLFASPSGKTEEAVSAVSPAALPAYRMGKGLVEGEKEAASQTKQQFKKAGEVKGDPVVKAGRYAQAGVTGLSMLDPFATGSVTNINRLQDAGRYKEAIGAGTFDALTLLAGKLTGGEKSTATKVNKLGFASGGAESSIESALPDIERTVKDAGRQPKTIGEFSDTVQSTLTRLDQQFNTALSKAKGRFVPRPISDALEAKAKTMPPTAEGRAMAADLRKAAIEYQKPWTDVELNQERMYRNAAGQGFHGKSATGQMAALRSNVDTMVDKIVADSARDVLYDNLDRQFPGQDFRRIKSAQSHLLDVKDQLDKQVEALKHADAMKKGRPFLGKAPSVYASAGPTHVFPRMHIHMPGRSPMGSANAAVKGAFSGPATGTKAAILSLPLATLTDQSKELPPLQ